jgi:predicted transcriptional regulator
MGKIEELEWRAQWAKGDFREWFEKVKENPDAVPPKTVVFTWSEEEMAQVFTKERLKLFRKIQEKPYPSIKTLAKELERDESRVRKDLRILESYGLVELRKRGRQIEIKSEVQAIYITVEKVPLEKVKV